jgi:hypothetical protein
MPDDRTVLDHLLDGRDALLQEVTRLTAAIEQLDSVLGRIGASDRGQGNGTAAPGLGQPATITTTATMVTTESAAGQPATAAPAEQVAAEPVNPPAEVEPDPTPTPAPRSAVKATKAPSRVAKKAPAKAAVKAPAKSPAKAAAKSAQKSAPRAVGRSGEPPKSIRVHVLEMLAAENRDFGLAEIIDRVHDAGIQAHDDAVRSITIKLMKDGRVERVGRGQYRLARRGAAARAASAATATAPRVTETAPEPIAPPAAPTEAEPARTEEPTPAESALVESTRDEPTRDEPTPVEPARADGSYESATTDGAPAEPEIASDDSLDADESDDDAPQSEFTPVSVPSSYTPPLNLGQPWSGGK